jgi:lysophospholipase L1-like esterase
MGECDYNNTKMSHSLKIFFLGDSLTEFFDWQARFPEHEVLNLGLAGETVQGLSARIRRIMGSASVPDVIFIMTGINNIAMEDYDILTHYERILRSLKLAYPSVIIIVQSILPVAMWADNNKIEGINHRLMELAKKIGLSFLDVYSSFTDETGGPQMECLQEDGVHLSEKGYEVWSAEVVKLLDHLPRKSSRSRSSSSRE